MAGLCTAIAKCLKGDEADLVRARQQYAHAGPSVHSSTRKKSIASSVLENTAHQAFMKADKDESGHLDINEVLSAEGIKEEGAAARLKKLVDEVYADHGGKYSGEVDEDHFTEMNVDVSKKYKELALSGNDSAAVEGELLLLYVLIDKYQTGKKRAEAIAEKAMNTLYKVQEEFEQIEKASRAVRSAYPGSTASEVKKELAKIRSGEYMHGKESNFVLGIAADKDKKSGAASSSSSNPRPLLQATASASKPTLTAVSSSGSSLPPPGGLLRATPALEAKANKVSL